MKSIQQIFFVLGICVLSITACEAVDTHAVPTKTPIPTITDDSMIGVPAKVAIQLVISVTGEVKSAVVQKSTDPRFEASALAAVKKWKFEPAKKDGVPVECTVVVPMSFS